METITREQLIEVNEKINRMNLTELGDNHINDMLKICNYNSFDDVSVEDLMVMYRALFILTKIYLINEIKQDKAIH